MGGGDGLIGKSSWPNHHVALRGWIEQKDLRASGRVGPGNIGWDRAGGAQDVGDAARSPAQVESGERDGHDARNLLRDLDHLARGDGLTGRELSEGKRGRETPPDLRDDLLWIVSR